MRTRTNVFDGQDTPLLQEALCKTDDWTSVSDKKERRKVQNRLYQRAARRRKNPQHTTHLRARLDDVHRGHQVGELLSRVSIGTKHRVLESRVEDTQQVDSIRPGTRSQTARTLTPTIASTSNCVARRRNRKCETSQIPSAQHFQALILSSDYIPLPFPPSLDHLVPVVQSNTYRAMITNMRILSLIPQIICTTPPNFACSRLSLPLPSNIPSTLYPTKVQQSIPHPEWMNIFPMPSVRDALIMRWADTYSETGRKKRDFDHCAFGYDILGAVNGDVCQGRCCEFSEEEHKQDYRQGLIVWGDPWEPQSWEVTEGFMRKWGWMMKGCWEGVLSATNYWRDLRGEEPLAWVVGEED